MTTKTTIRIEAHSRWDALDLTRALPSCEWFLVARGPDRWEVCVRADRRRRGLIRQLLEAAEAWSDRRALDSVVHLPDRDLALGRRSEATGRGGGGSCAGGEGALLGC